MNRRQFIKEFGLLVVIKLEIKYWGKAINWMLHGWGVKNSIMRAGNQYTVEIGEIIGGREG